MKIYIIFLVVLVFVISMLFMGIGCKIEGVEEVTEEKEEEVTEEKEEAVEEGFDLNDPSTWPEATLRFCHNWGASERYGPEFDNMLKEWEEGYPNLNLECEFVVGDELRPKIRADAAAGNLPDVFQYWGQVYIVDLAHAGMLLEMDKLLELTDVIKREELPDLAWNNFSVDGTLYGIPVQAYIAYFIYNKEIFEECGVVPPKTIEEWYDAAEVFNAKGYVPINLGSKGGNPGHFWFSDLMYQLDGAKEEIATLNETWNFDTANNLYIAEQILDQKAHGLFPDDTIGNGDWGPSFTLYNEEKAAACYSYPWMVSALKDEIYEKSAFLDKPVITGGTIQPEATAQGGFNFGIEMNAESWEDPDKQPYLLAFANWFMSDEIQSRLTQQGFQISAKLLTEKGKDKIEALPLIKDAFAYAIGKEVVPCHWDTWPPNIETQEYYLESLDELYAGTITARGFVDSIQEVLDDAKVIYEEEQQ